MPPTPPRSRADVATPSPTGSHVNSGGAPANARPRGPPRLVSLDMLRGVAIVIMVFVNAGGCPPLHTDHAPWDSRDSGPFLHLADYACPFFVFCIGASLALTSTSRRWRLSPKGPRLRHIATRTLKMLLIGFFIKNGNVLGPGRGTWDLRTIRLVSVLSRLGLSYAVVALLLVWLSPPPPPSVEEVVASDDAVPLLADGVTVQADGDDGAGRRRTGRKREGAAGAAGSVFARLVPEVAEYGAVWVAVLALQAVYLGFTFGFHVPGCSVGYLGPGGNDGGGPGCDEETGFGCVNQNCTGGFMGYFDTSVLGRRHLVEHGVGTEFCRDVYKCPGPFDPNGLWGVLPSVFHVLLGFTIGRVLKLYHGGRAARRLLAWAVAWVAVAAVLDGTGWIPISKTMWSLSYVFGSSGVATLVLLLFFASVDADGWVRRRCGASCRGGWLRSTGQNSIFLYVLSESVTPVLVSFCLSDSDSPGPACNQGDFPNGRGMAHDNTVLGLVYRALWAVSGGTPSDLRQDEPDSCFGDFPTGSWELCRHYYVASTLWSLLNVALIVVVGIALDRRGILVKL